jgi:RNA polymerase sigma-70 factor (ECF subfamily)
MPPTVDPPTAGEPRPRGPARAVPAGGGVDADGFTRALGAARDGDEDAFAVLWRAYQPGLLRFLTGLAGPDDGAEVAATVWLEVVRGLDRFTGDRDQFRAWIFTVGRQRFVDLRRSQGRRPSLADHHDDIRPGAVAPGPEELAEAAWSTDAAIRLIGELPPAQAEVVLLRVVADLDVDTVAGIVGRRPGAVRVLAHRGLRRLAERLADTPVVSRDFVEPG